MTHNHNFPILLPTKSKVPNQTKMSIESGVDAQNRDGSREAPLLEEAKERLAAMSPEKRELYKEVDYGGHEVV